jgi:hypothetical protein
MWNVTKQWPRVTPDANEYSTKSHKTLAKRYRFFFRNHFLFLSYVGGVVFLVSTVQGILMVATH